MNFPRYILVLACGCGVALSAAAASIDLTTLIARSPFMPPGGASPAGAATEPAAPLEFRGIAVEPEGTFFSVFDATANRGYWLREGMLDGAIRVARYDQKSGALEIEQNGRAVKLALKQASTSASATPILTAAAPVSGRVRGRTLQVPPIGDQSERMAQIAKEVRDRRAARQTSQTAQRRAAAASVSPGL